ncbi:unnamed protein product [Discula destructiva]
MDEKVLPISRRRSNAVGFCLVGIRIWQWSSAFFIYASFSLLHDHVQKNKLGESNRTKAVEVLGLVSLIYTTFIICGVHISKTLGLRSWPIFAMLSFVGDLTSMGLCIAKITILSFSGLPADCHGLTRDNYKGNDLVRQPANGYSTIRFGSWASSMTGELDRWCTFPRTVYGLSVFAIFSYTFTLLLSVLYLQQLKREVIHREKVACAQPDSPGPTLRYVGVHIASSLHTPSILDLDMERSNPSSPVLSAHPPSHSHSRASSPRRPQQATSTRSSRASSTSSSWGGITLGTCSSNSDTDTDTDTDTDSVRSGGSLPPLPPVPGSSTAAGAARPPQRRWSTSTSSSFDANAFLVTDGFRPAAGSSGGEDDGEGEDMPPAYESRPGSLYNETMKYPAGLGMPGTPKP